MSAVAEISVVRETLADVLERIGSVPLNRIRARPYPGSATEADLLTADKPLCELVDGVLVEKPMGFYESRVAFVLGGYIHAYLKQSKRGFALGADGLLRLSPGLVRVPDLSYFSWDRLPGRRLPRTAILAPGPDIAVEVLSPSNTEAEMALKLREYFEAGATLVWYIDPLHRTVCVFTGPRSSILLGEADILSGDSVLPGFALSIRELFEEAGELQDDHLSLP